MLSVLERKKKQVELSRVRSSREELELKIMELDEQKERLSQHIQIQLNKEAELVKDLEGEK